MALNINQLENRKDGSTYSCVVINPYDNQVEKPRRKIQDKTYNNYMSRPKQEIVINQRMEDEFLKTTNGFEDEDFLDEARTNEEMFEESLI